MAAIHSLCVYCGSQPGLKPEYIKAANTLGTTMANNNIRLVYGGGSRGLMGAVSRSVQENNGKVLGIIPEFLMPKEGEWDQSHKNLEIMVTESMHERKQKMFEESDAFVALPGGIGTLEEIVEIITWAQLGRHQKPIAFLNTNGFWDPMLSLIKHMKEAGFIHTEKNIQPIIVNNAEDFIPLINKSIS